MICFIRCLKSYCGNDDEKENVNKDELERLVSKSVPCSPPKKKPQGVHDVLTP